MAILKTHRGRSWTARAACLLVLSLLPFFPSLSHASLPPSDNQLVSITDNLDASKSLSFSYDLSGSLISKTQGGTATEYLYDARNALTAVKQGASTLALFAYDAEGRRREKVGLDGLVRYVRDGESVLLETDVAGAAVVKYEQAGSRLVSLTHATQGRQYYLQDALGTTANLTTAAGYIQATYQSGAWGSTRKTLGSSVNTRLFTGKERDVETGLYYFGARYYDPETGRFLTADPYPGDVLTPPSLHRYLYAYGNPVRYIDPTGRMVEELFPEHLEEKGLTDADLNDAGAVVEESLVRGQKRIEQDGSVEARVVNNLFFKPAQGVMGLKEAFEEEARRRARHRGRWARHRASGTL